MSPEQAAHLRLMALLPVRTHTTDMQPNPNRAFPKEQLTSVKREMKKMREGGMTLKGIGVAFGVAPATVLRYLK
jgi:DNA-binding CsgD family transcriptional regulator